MKTKCKKCNEELKPENNFCPKCGTEREAEGSVKDDESAKGDPIKSCPECFSNIPTGETECPRCKGETKGTPNLDDERPSECPKCKADIEPFMNYCPDCCKEITWRDIHGNNECFNCKTEVAPDFNYCYACGECILDDDEEPYEPEENDNGFDLEHECDNEDCGGLLADYMLNCPWCGETQECWEYGDYECNNCSNNIDEDWTYCPLCGEDVQEEE